MVNKTSTTGPLATHEASTSSPDPTKNQILHLFLQFVSQVSDLEFSDHNNLSTIPTQHRVSMQILKRDTVNPSETSNLRFRSRVVLNNSVFSHNSVSLPLRTEMGDLESQEVDAPKSILWYKPMTWLGQIIPHYRDESWSPSL